MAISATVRSLSILDDMTALTDVIHAAYAKRAANNLRYWASHQTIDDTAGRVKSGHGLVAVAEGRIVGTLTVRPPKSDSGVALYREPTTWTLCQFTVLPEFQGSGVGRQLHDAALEHAWSNGGRVIALAACRA